MNCSTGPAAVTPRSAGPRLGQFGSTGLGRGILVPPVNGVGATGIGSEQVASITTSRVGTGRRDRLNRDKLSRTLQRFERGTRTARLSIPKDRCDRVVALATSTSRRWCGSETCSDLFDGFT
jgi:hypothetical protein